MDRFFLQAAQGNYRPKRTEKIKYIVIHYTANNGDTALGNARYFHNNKNLKTSAHYFVDEKSVWQSVKDGDTAYHCGGTKYVHGQCRNVNALGIEMCSKKDRSGKYYIPSSTIKNTIELTKMLMEKYEIDSCCILRHYDVTGKKCPEPFVRDVKQWVEFRRMIMEGNEVKKKIKIKLNGKEKQVESIESKGYNYVKLQDLRDDKIEISYDGMPIIKVK